MTEEKTLPAAPAAAAPASDGPPAVDQAEAVNPATGGSYTRDPLTGELHLQQPAAPTTERSE